MPLNNRRAGEKGGRRRGRGKERKRGKGKERERGRGKERGRRERRGEREGEGGWRESRGGEGGYIDSCKKGDVFLCGTVKPPIMDPPRSRQPLYSGQTLCYRLKLLYY